MPTEIASTTEPIAVTPLGVAAPLIGWLIPGGGHEDRVEQCRALVRHGHE